MEMNMAVYFQLYPIGYSEPATFQQIDSAICQNVDGLSPWHAKHWVCSWYDIIGFKLALGKTYQQITDDFKEMITKYPEDADVYYDLIRINHYLLDNYTVNAWAGR